MTTAVVILNWNGKGFLEKYLPPLIRSVDGMPGVSIVVADNGSTDGSAEMMAELFPGIRFLPLGRNYGFAEGYNRALNKLQADCFLLLNSDVEVEQGWLDPLVEWMEFHPDCAVCGPKLHMVNERDRFEYAGAAGGYIDRLGFPFCRGRVFGRTEIDTGQYDIPADVLWVSGAAMMVRSKAYFFLGGLCGDFFAHMEEIDFCWRARLEGWKVSVVPRSVVYHLGGGTLPQESPYKLFLNYRNNLLMLSRCLPETLALQTAFNLLGNLTSSDDGPDMLENCADTFRDMDKNMRKDFAESAAIFGAARAGALIRRRMAVDFASALVYLLKGKPECFRAVLNAHREYKEMKKNSDTGKLRRRLENILNGGRMDIAGSILTDDPSEGNFPGKPFALKAVWRKWIVWQSAFRKEDVFTDIKDNLI